MKINKILSILLVCGLALSGEVAISAPPVVVDKDSHVEDCTEGVYVGSRVEQLSITRGRLTHLINPCANLKVLLLKQMQSVCLSLSSTPLVLQRLEIQAEELELRSKLTCEEANMDVGVLRQSNGAVGTGEQKMGQSDCSWSEGCIGHGAVYGHIVFGNPSITRCTELPLGMLGHEDGGVPHVRGALTSMGHIEFGTPTRIKNLILKARTFAAFTDGLEVDRLTLHGGALKVAGNTMITQLTMGGDGKLVAGPWTRTFTRGARIGSARDHCGSSEYHQAYVGELLVTPPARVHIGSIEGYGGLENRGGFVEVHGMVDQRKIKLLQTAIALPAPVSYYGAIRSHIEVSSGKLFGYHGAPQSLSGTVIPELIFAGGVILNDKSVLNTGRWFSPRALVMTPSPVHTLPADKIPALCEVLKSRRDLIIASTGVSADFGQAADRDFQQVFEEFRFTGVGTRALATYNPQSMVWSSTVASQYRDMIAALDGQRVMMGNVLFVTPPELERWDTWNAERQQRLEEAARVEEARRLAQAREEALRIAREEAARKAAVEAAAKAEAARKALEEQRIKEEQARKMEEERLKAQERVRLFEEAEQKAKAEARRLAQAREEALRIAREEAARKAAVEAAAKAEAARKALEEQRIKEEQARKMEEERLKAQERVRLFEEAEQKAKAEARRLAQDRKDAEAKAQAEEEVASTALSARSSPETFLQFLARTQTPCEIALSTDPKNAITLQSQGGTFKAINIGVLSHVPVNLEGQFQALGTMVIQAPEVGFHSTVTTHSSHQRYEGGSYSITRQSLERTSVKADQLIIDTGALKTTAVDIKAGHLQVAAHTWQDNGAHTTTSDRRVVEGKKSDAVYTGSSTAFNASNITSDTVNVRVRNAALEGIKTAFKDGGRIQAENLLYVEGRSSSTETASNKYVQMQRFASTAVVGVLQGGDALPEQLQIDVKNAVFRGTQFKGDVEINAQEKVALLAAANTDGYEKVEVLKDSRILQKVQPHQGQGVSYTDCAVEGRLTVNTPQLETSTTTGARPGGIEVVPREEFTEINHTVQNRIEEHSGKVQTALKPGFKAALGVGISALGLATGGIGTLAGASVASTLATTALTSASMSFLNHGLESALNHQSINLRKILKDTGKSVAVAALTMGATELIPADLAKNGAVKVAVSSAAHHGVYRQNLVQTIAGQSISEAAALGAGHIGAAYQANDLDWASHKLVHGALAMASTLAYGSLNQDMDWGRALVAAGAVMGAETAAELVQEELLKCVEGQLPKPGASEPEEAYIERFEAATQALAEKTASCLRVLTAAGLTLADQDASTIMAADSAVFNGLENNWVHLVLLAGSALLSGLEVYDGAEEVQDALEQGEKAQATLVAAKTAVKAVPGMKIGKSILYASETWEAGKAAYAAEGLVGVGKTAAKQVLGRRISRLAGKGLQRLQGRMMLRRAPKDLGSSKALKGRIEDGGKHAPTAEEKAAVEKYFTEHREKKFVVDTYGGETIDKAQKARNAGNPGRTERHHVGTHKNNTFFVDKDFPKKDGISILIPKDWHQFGNIHNANKVQYENFRQALFTSIKDMRKLPDRMHAGALREEVRKDLNEALLEALKKNKELFPEHLKK